MTVWTLIMAFNIYNGGGPMVVDNLPSRAECLAMAAAVRSSFPYETTQSRRPALCVAHRVAVPHSSKDQEQ